MLADWHYRKPNDVGQLKPVWIFVPHSSPYVGDVIEVLRYQLQEYARTMDNSKDRQMWQLYKFIESVPDLRDG